MSAIVVSLEFLLKGYWQMSQMFRPRLFEGRGMNETVRAVFGWLSGPESTTDQNPDFGSTLGFGLESLGRGRR
jgi:hypothetical protein